MRFSSSLTVALAATVTAKPNIKEANKESNVVPGAYIVEFEAGHDSVDTFYQSLASSGIEAAPRQQFTTTGIFTGASFHLGSDKKSWVDAIGNFTQAPISSGWENIDFRKLKKKNLDKRAEPITLANDNFTTHVMTGVDKLHKEGLDGAGITIAVIDTGIDYKLDALGGGFGPGYKVAFGTDLVGDDYTGFNTPVPDDDPIDCAGHGTHVTGIIAASNDPLVIGVAPAATLGIYKVFGCVGEVQNDVLITAFLMAYEHGVDVISSSIGGASGWPEEPWAAATAAIVAAGTPCILSAGNSGANGLYFASSASAGDDVTSVGSVDNTHLPKAIYRADYTIDGAAGEFEFTPGSTGGIVGVSLPLWADSFDTSVANDFCLTSPPITEDLTGKIALIRRGGCTFVEKANVAAAAGAEYAIIYNNQVVTVSPAVDGSDIKAVVSVDIETGEIFVNALAAGKEVIATFSENGSVEFITPGEVNTVTGGYMSTYSSWNPSHENTIKPVVSAPGGGVLSTYPGTGYDVLSGTSMAAPFIAGVVALYKQAKGKNVSPKTINAVLSASAQPLKFNDGTTTFPYLASVAQQGGGLVDAYKVIHGGLRVTEANLAYNDTAHHVKNAAFYVENIGSTEQTYTLTHDPAANFYAFSADLTDSVATFPGLPADTKYSTAVISPSTLTVKPGQKKRVTVSVTPDASLDSSLVPFYSGFIKVAGGSDSLTLPYGGAATVMHDIGILETNQGWPYWDNELAVSVDGPLSTYKPSEGSYPYVFWANKWATISARLDVISVSGPNPLYEAGVAIVGSLPNFPLGWQPRGTFSAVTGAYNGVGWDGLLADGTVVPSGTYKLSLRFAKVFADLNKGREYERYDSDPFVMDMS